ncbi:hypothetical protein V1T76_28630 [Roseibium sp. FZY0029]|uniref:hypothetical protein n=1 Tax=Roseibium sp. FZY0029 TaxID=3116647 RepID=UPI002ECA0B31|nr:hypothetical protein [Roseibium sp. FZY0029]
MVYDLHKSLKSLDWLDLADPLDRASRSLTRADERLRRTHALEDGVRSRSHLFETCASMALDGDLVHLEDLVLHDAGTDRRAPTHELTRAARFLALRRRVDRQTPDSVLSRDGLLALVGRPTEDTEFETTTIRNSGEGRGGDLPPQPRANRTLPTRKRISLPKSTPFWNAPDSWHRVPSRKDLSRPANPETYRPYTSLGFRNGVTVWTTGSLSKRKLKS